MAKKTAPKKTKSTKKQQQTTMQGEAFKRPNRIPELDEQAERYRKARNKWQDAGEVMGKEKQKLKEVMKKHGMKESYFYDDEDGDTEEVKPIVPDPEDIDVKVNKVKQAKAKADE